MNAIASPSLPTGLLRTWPGRAPDHGAVAAAVAMAAVVITGLQAVALSAAGPAFPFPRGAAWAVLFSAAYGASLALFFLVRLRERHDARLAALFLSLYSLNLSLSIVPSQAPSLGQVSAFAISMAFVVVAVRFATVFPRRLSLVDFEESDGAADVGASPLRARRGIALLQRQVVKHPAALWVIGALLVVLWWVRTRYAAAPYFLPFGDSRAPLSWIGTFLLAPLTLLVAGLAVSFLYRGYRTSGPHQRQKILWIVLSAVVVAFLMVAVHALNYLTIITRWDMLYAVRRATLASVLPVSSFAVLTGFALAVLYSGAFDLRPVITRTAIYGVLVLSLTFLFAAVEEVVQSHVIARLRLPEGIGTWIGAGAVALVLGPLKDRLEDFFGRRRAEASKSAPEP